MILCCCAKFVCVFVIREKSIDSLSLVSAACSKISSRLFTRSKIAEKKKTENAILLIHSQPLNMFGNAVNEQTQKKRTKSNSIVRYVVLFSVGIPHPRKLPNSPPVGHKFSFQIIEPIKNAIITDSLLYSIRYGRHAAACRKAAPERMVSLAWGSHKSESECDIAERHTCKRERGSGEG